jgi:DNA adenine methylase
MGIHASAFDRKTGGIYDYFDALSARLRRVRVCCGDWRRVTGPSVTYRHGLTAVFLDPPYVQDGRADVYGYESQVFADVRQWAIESGQNPLMRIALCGYDFTMPDGWQCVRWKAPGGYGSQGDGQGRANAHREVIWFSPHCLDLNALPIFAYLDDNR